MRLIIANPLLHIAFIEPQFLTIIFKIGCRNEIFTSLERQRSSFELARWRTWRSYGRTNCVPAAFSFRKLYVAGLQSNDTPKYAALCCFYRYMAVVPLPAGWILLVYLYVVIIKEFLTLIHIFNNCCCHVHCLAVASVHHRIFTSVRLQYLSSWIRMMTLHSFVITEICRFLFAVL